MQTYKNVIIFLRTEPNLLAAELAIDTIQSFQFKSQENIRQTEEGKMFSKKKKPYSFGGFKINKRFLLLTTDWKSFL